MHNCTCTQGKVGTLVKTLGWMEPIILLTRKRKILLKYLRFWSGTSERASCYRDALPCPGWYAFMTGLKGQSNQGKDNIRW